MANPVLPHPTAGLLPCLVPSAQCAVPPSLKEPGFARPVAPPRRDPRLPSPLPSSPSLRFHCCSAVCVALSPHPHLVGCMPRPFQGPLCVSPNVHLLAVVLALVWGRRRSRERNKTAFWPSEIVGAAKRGMEDWCPPRAVALLKPIQRACSQAGYYYVYGTRAPACSLYQGAVPQLCMHGCSTRGEPAGA